MNDITKINILQEILKQEKCYSIQLDFEDLLKKGIVERKKGTKWTFAMLKPDEFPTEAMNQVEALIKVTTTISGVKITKNYFVFPNEKQRLKTLMSIRKNKKLLSK